MKKCRPDSILYYRSHRQIQPRKQFEAAWIKNAHKHIKATNQISGLIPTISALPGAAAVPAAGLPT